MPSSSDCVEFLQRSMRFCTPISRRNVGRRVASLVDTQTHTHTHTNIHTSKARHQHVSTHRNTRPRVILYSAMPHSTSTLPAPRPLTLSLADRSAPSSCSARSAFSCPCSAAQWPGVAPNWWTHTNTYTQKHQCLKIYEYQLF